ncbi:hypothetical protein PJW08_09520 [Tenacibaculum finnmarkense]|nr:hypothetical protein PJW08_09520 [Tenacibaculum finnmarkense]
MNAITSAESTDDNISGFKNYWLSIETKTNQNIKKIKFKKENRRSGMGRANDQLWKEWKKLENGEFYENDSQFVLKSTDNQKYVAEKSGVLVAAKMYNRFLSADLENFEVYEGQNPSGGYFILYKFKDENKQNEFVITSIMGIAEGSYIILEIE